ncbi:hypothetical protein F511_37140 [Dorcoceras hygrometricum]|uniref:Uncharacterized protein n=1 Tax=Dorcoceras hygrometricum TaxID=472368 RepID=A0A2Z7AF56_9LAMI|nr:hypothetical protein F511_37140 [Dorcoceras hygrometricum]
MSTGYAKLATGFIATAGSLKLSTGCVVACVWLSSWLDQMLATGYQRKEHLLNRKGKTLSYQLILLLDFLLYDVASLLRLDVRSTCWYLATAGLKPSADYDDVTDDVINAKPSADSSARPGGFKCLRLVVQLVRSNAYDWLSMQRASAESLAQGQNAVVSTYLVVQSLVEKLATGFPNDCSRLDVAAYWSTSSAGFLSLRFCRIHSAKAKRCRINLCKQHRYPIAISKYHLLVNISLLLDFLLYDVASLSGCNSSYLLILAIQLRRHFILFTSLLIC